MRSVYTLGYITSTHFGQEQDIKSKKDIEAAFHALNLCPQETIKRSLMAERKQEEPTNQSKSLTDSDTSDDIEVNPRFKPQ